MKRLKSIGLAAVLGLAAAAQAGAGGHSAGVTDQTYKAGKYAHGAGYVTFVNNCPREHRELYRGSLYCRQPVYPVVTARHAACPDDVWGLYRGNMYCFGRR
jgi:hypothetical protein